MGRRGFIIIDIEHKATYMSPICESYATDAESIICVSGIDGSTEEWDEVDWSNY